jgi:hypothetical protein
MLLLLVYITAPPCHWLIYIRCSEAASARSSSAAVELDGLRRRREGAGRRPVRSSGGAHRVGSGVGAAGGSVLEQGGAYAHMPNRAGNKPAG